MSTINITRDPREQLITQIEALKNTASEVAPSVACVLATLLGALKMGEEDLLAAHVLKFAEVQLMRLIMLKEERGLKDGN